MTGNPALPAARIDLMTFSICASAPGRPQITSLKPEIIRLQIVSPPALNRSIRAADVGLLPRNPRPADEHVVDADLLDAAHVRLVGRDVAETDLGCVLAFGRHARKRRPGLRGARRHAPRRRRDAGGRHGLQELPSTNANAHGVLRGHS